MTDSKLDDVLRQNTLIAADRELIGVKADGLTRAVAILGDVFTTHEHESSQRIADLEWQLGRVRAERDKAEAELRTIELKASMACDAVRPDGSMATTFTGPLDAVASLDVYARNLKTRLAACEAPK